MRALCFHGLKAEQELESWMGFRSRLAESRTALRQICCQLPWSQWSSDSWHWQFTSGGTSTLIWTGKKICKNVVCVRTPTTDKNLHNFFTKVLTKLLAARRDGRKGWNEALATVPSLLSSCSQSYEMETFHISVCCPSVGIYVQNCPANLSFCQPKGHMFARTLSL